MKILHIIASYKPAYIYGGPIASVSKLCESIRLLSFDSAQDDKDSEDFVGVLLETAHPAKFVEVVEEVLKTKIEIPEKLEAFNKKEKQSVEFPADFELVKQFLMAEK